MALSSWPAVSAYASSGSRTRRPPIDTADARDNGYDPTPGRKPGSRSRHLGGPHGQEEEGEEGSGEEQGQGPEARRQEAAGQGSRRGQGHERPRRQRHRREPDFDRRSEG